MKEFFHPTAKNILAFLLLETASLVLAVVALRNYYGWFGVYLIVLTVGAAVVPNYLIACLIAHHYRHEKLLYLILALALATSFFTDVPQTYYQKIHDAAVCPDPASGVFCGCVGIVVSPGPLSGSNEIYDEGKNLCVGIRLSQQSSDVSSQLPE